MNSLLDANIVLSTCRIQARAVLLPSPPPSPRCFPSRLFPDIRLSLLRGVLSWSDVSPRRFIVSLDSASRLDRSIKCIHARLAEASGLEAILTLLTNLSHTLDSSIYLLLPDRRVLAVGFLRQIRSFRVAKFTSLFLDNLSLQHIATSICLRNLFAKFIYAWLNDFADFRFRGSHSTSVGRARPRAKRISISNLSRFPLKNSRILYWNGILELASHRQKCAVCAWNCVAN